MRQADKKRVAWRTGVLLRATGLRVSYLTEVLNTPEKTVSSWKNGHCCPNEDSRTKIEDTFGLQRGWLESEADLPVSNLRFL